MIKIEQISLPIKFSDKDITDQICKKIKVSRNEIEEFEIYRLSVDARKKPDIRYVASVCVCLKGNLESKFKSLKFNPERKKMQYEMKNTNKTFVVVGFGPSGMFAALALAKMGLKPIIIEKGKMVEERENDVKKFWTERKLNKYSNVQFGEGGAGTFSDGKLNTTLNNDYCKMVINEFYQFLPEKYRGKDGTRFEDDTNILIKIKCTD